MIEVDAGEAIHFTNDTQTAQSVTSDEGLFDSGPIPPGGGFSMAISVPGPHVFRSTANPGFVARVVVPVLGLPGAPGDLANDRIPQIEFPAPRASDLDVHPRLAVPASKTRILIGWKPTATVAAANAALEQAGVEIIGGLPATGILLGEVDESWCCWGEEFGLDANAWAEGEQSPPTSFDNLDDALLALRSSLAVEFAALDLAGAEQALPPRSSAPAEAGAGWDWGSPELAGNWGLHTARFQAAWNLIESVRAKGPGTATTAIIDAGFEAHDDLPALQIDTELCPGGACLAVPNDPSDHGNHVAGTIGADFDAADPSAAGRSLGVSGGNPFADMRGYSTDGFNVHVNELGGSVHLYAGMVQLFDHLLRDPPPGLRVINFSMKGGMFVNLSTGKLFEDAEPIWWRLNPSPYCGPGPTDDDLPEIEAGMKAFCTPDNHDGWQREFAHVGHAAARVARLASASGVLIVQAAGNDGAAFCPPKAPAAGAGACGAPGRGSEITEFGWVGARWSELGDGRPNPILLVEAADTTGDRAPWSNTGDIAAFGGEPTRSTVLGDGYGDMEGTSMSAPQVTAAAGYLLAQEPGLGLGELRARLLAWGEPHPDALPGGKLFEWRVPDRLGRDRDGNQVIDYTVESDLSPSSFRVDFDACGTLTAGRYVWTIDGATVATSGNCRYEHIFPAEGDYSVGLTVTGPGGLSQNDTQTVRVEDLLLVSIGDSIASGEGNPAVPKENLLRAAVWEQERCHRSALAGPAKTARWLEAADVKSSVTFLHLACSGGRMTGDPDPFGNPVPGDSGVGGLLTPYEGIEPPDGRCVASDRRDLAACLPPQLAETKRLLGNRTPDALMISIGANDMQFSTIVKDCIVPLNDCSAPGNSGRDTFDGRIGLLAPRYDLLARRIALAFPDLPADRVFLTEYPDPTHDGSGIVDMSCLPVTDVEAGWAASTVVTGLNAQVRAAAAAHGWTAVAGIGADFGNHGYCADDTWFVRLGASFGGQGDPEGSFHPNGKGQNAYARRIVAALRTKLGLGAVEPSRPVRDIAPRLDAFAAAAAAEGAAKALVDVNDPSEDGNRRIVYEPDGSGGMTETPDEVSSRDPARATAPDGFVDMRDFRRFRDAWLARCIENDADADCPADPAGDSKLDGAADHPKRDGNLDNCVYRAGDPAGCGASELDGSRFDFNGDGAVSTDKETFVPIDDQGKRVADPSQAAYLDDLGMLETQWSLDPRTAEGWGPTDLRTLLRSADVEVHADEIFAEGARTADVRLRLKGGADVGPLRRIRKSDPSIMMTIPITAGDEFELVARADSPNGTMESISEAFPLLYGEDRRVDLCPGLTLKASPNRVPADGRSTSKLTATLHRCKAGNVVAGLPITFSLAPAGSGTLDLTPSVTNAQGKAEARFTASTTDTTATVRAEVELPSGDTLDAEVEIRTVDELTIKYIWRQTIEDWSESGSTRWLAADPRQPDCTLAGVDYCIDSFSLNLTSQTGNGVERHGTLTGGGSRFTLTEQVLDSTTRSRSTWTLTHDDGEVEDGSRDSTWFVTDPQAYVDHDLTGLELDDEPDAVRLSGMQTVGDLPYHYALFGSGSGDTTPIEIGAAKNSLLLIPQGGAAPVRFAAHPDRALAFPRRPDGTLDPFKSCFTLDEDIAPEPGYLVVSPDGGYVPGSLSIGRKPDYAAGDRPMPVGPGHMKIQYAFAAVAYYAGSGAPSPTPVLPDCTVNNPPTAAFEFTPQVPEEGRQVSFRDKSTDLENDIKSWAWDFGDGQTTTGPNPFHLYEDDGTFVVTLTVTDRDGATGQTTQQVTIANLPPEASIDDAAGQQGQPLTLTYRVLDPGSIDKKTLHVRIASTNPVWPLLDETAPANVYSLTYLNLPAGIYPLKLTVTDKDGATATAEAVVSVTATPPPPPPPPPPPTTFPSCNPVVVLDAEEQAFLDLVNEYREDNGLPPVAVSPALTRAADVHAADMAQHEYMEHTGRDGSSPADRAWREGYPKTASVGENLATGTRTGSDALWAWRSSTTGHNENMLNPSWVAVGISRAQGSLWRWATSYGTQLDCGATPPPAPAGAPAGAEADEQPFAPTPTGAGAEPDTAEPVRVLGPGGESPVLEHEPLDAAPPTQAEPQVAEIAAAAADLHYAPTVAFTIADLEARENRPVTITNRSRDSNGDPIGATFDPDDSTAPIELGPNEAVAHRFQQPYTRYLTMDATDAADRSSALERYIWVQPKPTAYVYYNGENVGFVGKSVELAATIVDPDTDAPVAGAEVTFEIDQTTVLTATTNAAGRASVLHDLTTVAPGWYYVRVDYAGNEFLNGSWSSGSLQVIRNELPVADPGGPYVAGEGGSLLLNGLRSRDADDGIASYAWDLNGDGVYGDVTGRLPDVLEWDEILTLLCAGVCTPGHEYSIGLRVTDTRGDSSTAATTVRFTPDFDILLGGEGKTIVPGQSNSFAVTLIGSSSWTAPVTLSVSGLPAGVTASFSRNPIIPTGVSVLTITGGAGLADGTFPIRVTATGGGVTKEVSDEVEVAFGLIPICYGAVTGVVTDRITGLPLGGALVRLDNYQFAYTDPSGRYVIEQVSLGFNNAPRDAYLTSSLGGYWGAQGVSTEVACGAVSRADLSQLAIGKGVVSGTIVDKETKLPIPGSTINTSFCSWWGCSWVSLAPVDALGAFTAEVELGDQNLGRAHYLRAQAAGYWEEEAWVQVEPDRPGVMHSELVKKCYGTLAGGTVVWADNGLPAPGIAIGVYLSGGYRPDFATASDADGKFTVNRVVELGYRNTARHIGMDVFVPPPMSAHIIDPFQLTACGESDSARISVRRPVPNYGDVEGYVTDEETGTALPDQWVSTGNRSAQTNADGYYRIDDILVGYDSQRSNWVGVSTSRAGYYDAGASGELHADTVGRLDLKLLKRKFGSASGLVTDSVTGAPIPDALVSDGCYWYSPFLCASTNRQGRYSRDGIGLGHRNAPIGRLVTASAAGYWPQQKWVSVSANTDTVTDFQLQPECAPAAVRGIVVNAETQAPLQGAQVSGGSNWPSYTDANGRFEILGIRPSTGNNPRQIHLTAAATGFYSQTKQITIFCGANITITFGARTSKTGTIVGQVTDGDSGLPLANAFLGSDFGATARTDGDGNYRITDVPLGDLNSDREWTLLAQPTGYKTQTRTVVVRADVESRLDFVFSSANQPPSSNDQSVALDEDTSLAITTTGADPDGDTLTHHVLRYPAHGTLSGQLPNATYYPDSNYSGPDSFEFIVNDGVASSARASVTIDVRGLNDTPIAIDDQLDASVDVPLRIPAAMLLGNDRDVDPTDTLRISAVTLWNSQGSVVLEGNEVIFTPPPGWNNPIYYAFFTYTVTDGHGGYDTALVYVRVTQSPLPPTCADKSFSVTQDQPLAGSVSCSDPNGDALTYELVSGPAAGFLVFNADGSFTMTPTPGFVGSTSFSFRATDGTLVSAAATAVVEVTPTNSSPVAADLALSTDEDTPVGVVLPASDPDGDALTITHGQPLRGSFDGTTYTPEADFHGTDSFTYTAGDGVATDEGTVTLTVEPVNDPPEPFLDEVVVDEDTDATGNVLANDLDPEADSLTAAIETEPAHGDVSLAPNGDFEYTPDPNYNGSDSFSYRASDGASSEVAFVRIVVLPVEDAPVARDDFFSTGEDSAITGSVLANDTDAEGAALTAAVVGPPAHGSLALQLGGSFSYTPAPNYNGTDSFSYSASDPAGKTTGAVVTIVVRPVNDAPTAENVMVATDEDVPLGLVVAGDDVDGDALTTVWTQPGAGGYDGTTYTPAPNANGTDTFEYTVTDPSGASATATVTIVVRPVNDAPVATDAAVATNEDVPLTVTLAGTDLDGDTPLSFRVETGPAHGTYADGLYTPNSNYHGPDTISFAVDDGRGGTDAGTVAITVNPVNDAPVASDKSVTTIEDVPVVIAMGGTDVDGDVLAFRVERAPEHGTYANGTYTPAADYHGPDSFAYVADDGQGATDTATVEITVEAAADGPVAIDQSVSTDEDTPVDVTLTGRDLDGDPLVIALGRAPSHGSYTGGSYRPNSNYNGPDSFTFTVSDGVETNTGTITITVRPVNDAPVAGDQHLTTTEDTPLMVGLSASDVDGNLVTLSWGQPGHGSFDGTTYTPAAGFTGPDSFTYTASDGAGGSDEGTIFIVVQPGNRAPVVELLGPAEVDEGAAPTTFTAAAADPDGDSLSYEWTGATGSGASAAFAADDGPSYSTITVAVSDGRITTWATRLISVRNVAPTADAGPNLSGVWGLPLVLAGSAADPSRADTAAGILSSWSFGDGSHEATGARATHTYADPGQFLATLSARDKDGGVGSDTAVVTIAKRPTRLDYTGSRSVPQPTPCTGHDDEDERDSRQRNTDADVDDDDCEDDNPNCEDDRDGDAKRLTTGSRGVDGRNGDDDDDDCEDDGGRHSYAKRLTQTGGSSGGMTSHPYGSVTLSARLSDLADAATARLAGRELLFQVGVLSFPATTNAAGVAVARPSLPVPLGTYEVSVRFAGDSHYLPSQALAPLHVVSSPGKVTGGGLRSFAHPGRGGFNIQSSGGQTKGELQWQNGSVNFHASTLTALGIGPNHRWAWLSGRGRDGRPFTAYVEDNGEAGRSDIFKLWIAGQLQTPGDGRLTGGNIQIHK